MIKKIIFPFGHGNTLFLAISWISLIGAILFIAPITYSTNIADCTQITTNGGAYYLTNDITITSATTLKNNQTCIFVNASNITMDFQGHTIKDLTNRGNDKTLILMQPFTIRLKNVTIKNVRLEATCFGTQNCKGVYAYDLDNSTFSNITSVLSGSAKYFQSFRFSQVNDGKLENLYSSGTYSGSFPTSYGVYIGSCQNTTFKNSAFLDSGSDFDIYSTVNYNITTCGIDYNTILQTGESVTYNKSACSSGETSNTTFSNVVIYWDSIPANWTYNGEDYPILYYNFSGGTTPYNISLYVDNFLSSFWESYGNGSMNMGGTVGNHTVFLKVKDSNGIEKTSNVLNFTVYSGSSVNDVYLFLNVSQSDKIYPFDTISFYTSSITGGVAPYYVEILTYPLGTEKTVGYCYVGSGEVCSGDFNVFDIGNYNEGLMMIKGRIRDNLNLYSFTNGTALNMIKASYGDDLNIPFDTNGNISYEEVTHLYLTINGGKPPYKVVFLDNVVNGGTICEFNGLSNYYDLELYAFGGAHYFIVNVYSYDGQMEINDTGLTSISSGGAGTQKYYNRVINCVNQGGILGEYAKEYGEIEENDTTGPTRPISDLNTGIQSFINILTTPVVIWSVLIGIIGVMVEKMTNTGGKAMLIIFILGFNILALFNVIPRYLILIEVVILAVIFGLKMKGGS